MTTPDTKAIRAQYSDGEYLDAYPGEACATILALCDALDELRADIETCTAKRDEWADRAMTELGNVLDLRAENERMRAALRDVIGCDHHNFCDVGAPKYVRIARAALAQKGDQP